MTVSRLLAAISVAMTAAAVAAAATPATYKGLEINVTAVERSVNVSLADCPAGSNTVRGVIRPGDVNEFAVVKADFKVLPEFKPGPVPKPTLTDEAGKTYNTAQSFGDLSGTPSFTCAFAFRVPKGTKVKKFALDTASIDLGTMGQ